MATTFTTERVRRELGDYERELLAAVPHEGPYQTHLFVVWIDQYGDPQMGPCRFRRVTNQGTFFECSPFPGAWDSFVREEQILRVRHPEVIRNELR